MDAAGVFARDEECLDGRPARRIDDDAAHQEVGRWAHLDRLAGQVAAKVTAATHHAPEIGLDRLRAEMRDVDPDAAVGTAAPLLHLGETRARDQVTRRAFHALGVVVRHEALALAVEQSAARPTKAFLEKRARHQ